MTVEGGGESGGDSEGEDSGEYVDIVFSPRLFAVAFDRGKRLAITKTNFLSDGLRLVSRSIMQDGGMSATSLAWWYYIPRIYSGFLCTGHPGMECG